MSKAARRTIPINEGTSARALTMPLLDPDLVPDTPAPERTKPRTPLSLVVSTPKRGRQQLVVIFFMVIVAALAVVLVMSISVSKGQYELVGLKNHQTDLLKANQSLEQEIAAKSAPQELVANAAALGMVPAGTTGQIDVRTKTVSGSPQPAKADTKGLVNIPPALIDKPPAVTPNAESKAAGDAPVSPAATAAQDEKAAQQQDKAPVAEVPPAPVTPDLHGGTIPAPAQKDS
ncbi:hypothetical protein ART_0108 [Arthrobacter sp. PAMC 25486]|uniref:hypothetical protein n=1 Tax=Arthrobacter sp. PAMC 25486 TaxID=1494608 RepID=UPI000535F3A8|nr:hypothetical protein [Arthrobacter sp. PAMC 25486]AIX99706.1 hypothetical protein ART_0108 [Arthrobacter sp. PAMC 25486]